MARVALEDDSTTLVAISGANKGVPLQPESCRVHSVGYHHHCSHSSGAIDLKYLIHAAFYARLGQVASRTALFSQAAGCQIRGWTGLGLCCL